VGVKKMNRKKIGIIITTLALMLAMPFITPLSTAAYTTQTINGNLGGAEFILQIPSNWQGDLVVVCHGYNHKLSEVNLATLATRNSIVLTKGCALAISTYGEDGFCIQKGMIRIHQLTEYIIDNYHVTGKVLLVGVSLGGNIALQLGAKYPTLYDGVLDICGNKDVAQQFTDKTIYASLNDQDLTAALLSKGALVPPYPSTSLTAFRQFCTDSANDIVKECGGTPQEKPMAYQKASPLYNAVDIAIPTITLHGTQDGYVPYAQSVAFKEAVTAEGHSDLYRLYTIQNGVHAGPTVVAKMGTCLDYLLSWAKDGTPAPQVLP
jgi:predicted esterase